MKATSTIAEAEAEAQATKVKAKEKGRNTEIDAEMAIVAAENECRVKKTEPGQGEQRG